MAQSFQPSQMPWTIVNRVPSGDYSSGSGGRQRENCENIETFRHAVTLVGFEDLRPLGRAWKEMRRGQAAEAYANLRTVLQLRK